MGDLILTTFDWVPEMPRGYVRDLRVRWALEEAGLPYRVESTPFRDRKRRAFLAPTLRSSAVVDGLETSRSSKAVRCCFIWPSVVRVDVCRSALSQRG